MESSETAEVKLRFVSHLFAVIALITISQHPSSETLKTVIPKAYHTLRYFLKVFASCFIALVVKKYLNFYCNQSKQKQKNV